MGSLIVTWSPIAGQGGSSTMASAQSSLMALETTRKVMFTHAKPAKTVLDILYKTSDTTLTKGGMEGLERLVKSKMIKPESIPDYTDTIYTGKLDYLQSGFNEELSEKENAIYLFSVLKAALQMYDVVFVNVGSGLDSIATRELLKQADMVLVNLPQNRFVVEQFANGDLMPVELKDRPYYVVITNYDKKATYSIRNIKRQAKLKNKIFAFPYTTELKNAINLSNVSDYYFRSLKSKKGSETSDLIEAIRLINNNMLQDLGFIDAATFNDVVDDDE